MKNPSATDCFSVTGASLCGVEAVFEPAPALPPDFPTSMLFVQHIDPRPGPFSEPTPAHGLHRAWDARDAGAPGLPKKP